MASAAACQLSSLFVIPTATGVRSPIHIAAAAAAACVVVLVATYFSTVDVIAQAFPLRFLRSNDASGC